MKIDVHNPTNLPTIDYRTAQPLQGNLKNLTTTNYAKLKNILTKRGFTAPLFIWFEPETNIPYLMDGHGRQRVMQKEDFKPYEVPYVEITAPNKQDAKAQLLEITSQYQTITQEGFDEFVVDLPEAEIVEAVNFDALPFLGQQEEPETEEDEPPEVDDDNPPQSQLGEVYQLGRHRVMCGDSTNPDHVKQLLQDDTPNLMVTDPPYGVSYDPAWRDEADLGIGKRSRGKVAGDDRVDWTQAYSLHPGNVAYVWHADIHSPEVGHNLEDLGYTLVSQIIWVKQHFALSRGDYHRQHEPCWYAVKSGHPHNYQGDRKQTTTWAIANNNAFGGEGEEKFGHGTQKPIECMAKPIRNNSQENDAVYDPFLGSGSTLIAAEQLGRVCLGMDIDPKYVDQIRKRYAKFVGKESEWEQATPSIQNTAISS